MSEPVRAEDRRRTSIVGHLVRRGIPILVLLLALAGVYLYWRQTDSNPRHEPAPMPVDPVPVTVQVLREETVPAEMRFLGQTEASLRVEIRARVAGYLGDPTFKEGDPVEKGQKLFQIDPRPFEVALAEARAGLDSAQATLEYARYHLARVQELSAHNAATPLEVEDWQKQERVATAEVQLRSAQIAGAELNLSYTSIEAPITGLIGQALKDPGSYVDAGQNGLLATVYQVDPIDVRFSITEQEMLRFERQLAAGEITAPPPGQAELQITLADGSVYPHRGRIDYLDVEVDLTTGTSVVRGQVPNPDRVLKPGQFIHVDVLGIERVNVLRVPQQAVLQSPSGANVLVVNDESVAESHPVELGAWTGNRYWIVERGLAAGDRVITDRLMMVRAGVPVTISGTVEPDESDEASKDAGNGETSAGTSGGADGATRGSGGGR